MLKIPKMPKYTEIPAQVGKELAPADVWEEQVEEGGVLATPRQGDQERVLDLLQVEPSYLYSTNN